MNIAGQIDRLAGYADKAVWRDADAASCREVIARILGAPATEDSWLALLELFGAWPDTGDVVAWVAELEPDIDHWPWTVRHSTLGQRHTRGEKEVVYRLIGHLHIRNIDDSSGAKLARFGQNPNWCNLQGLTLYRVETQAADLARFLGSPHVNHLQRLELVALDSLHGHIPTLFEQPMPTLRSLKLANLGLNTQDFVALAACAPSQHLRELDLAGNHASARDLDMLTSPNAFPTLEWLSVGGADVDAASLDQILRAWRHPTLKKLSFPHTPAAKSLSRDWVEPG